jgi:hypothetical protein
MLLRTSSPSSAKATALTDNTAGITNGILINLAIMFGSPFNFPILVTGYQDYE